MDDFCSHKSRSLHVVTLAIMNSVTELTTGPLQMFEFLASIVILKLAAISENSLNLMFFMSLIVIPCSFRRTDL